jgi:hypothetical protein
MAPTVVQTKTQSILGRTQRCADIAGSVHQQELLGTYDPAGLSRLLGLSVIYRSYHNPSGNAGKDGYAQACQRKSMEASHALQLR